jgi:hypothetical protein
MNQRFDMVIIGNKILGKKEFFDYCTNLHALMIEYFNSRLSPEKSSA